MPVHSTAAEDRNNSCHLANGTGGDLQGTVQLACGELGGSPRRSKNPSSPHHRCFLPPLPLPASGNVHRPPHHPPTLCRPPNSQPAKRGRQRVTLWSVADTVGQGDMQGKRAITCGCTEQPQPISLQGDRLWATLRGSPRVCPGLGGHPNLQLGIEPSSAQEVLTQQRLSGV